MVRASKSDKLKQKFKSRFKSNNTGKKPKSGASTNPDRKLKESQ